MLERCADGGRWRHAGNSKLPYLQAINREQALTLSLVGQELHQFLPNSTYQDLSPALNGAQRVLAYPGNDQYARFRSRVRVLPEGPPRETPAPDPAVLREINEALLQGVQLDLRYQSSEEKAYRLHPVGLVQQGLFHWLLAVKDQEIFAEDILSKVQSFRCDRIRSIGIRAAEAVAREIPTLDAALDAGRLEFFAQEKPMRLRIRFAATKEGEALCNSFREVPLGSGQAIVPHAGGGHELITTVRHSLQLEWLLQRYADRITVIEPTILGDKLRQFIRSAAELQNQMST